MLLGDGNLCRAVPAGRSVVVPAPGVEGPACGLLPLLGPAVATTTGLRWNLGAPSAATPLMLTATQHNVASSCPVFVQISYCRLQPCITHGHRGPMDAIVRKQVPDIRAPHACHSTTSRNARLNPCSA